MHLSYIRLIVDNFGACYRFYRDTLGFATLWASDNYAEFQVGPATRLALCERAIMSVVPGAGWRPEAGGGDRAMLVFEVPDVDARVAELKSRGVEIVAEPMDRPEWTVRTAHLRDPEGNLIEINRPLRK